MARLRELRGVLPNFLGTFTSRYSEFDRFWIFGFLVPTPGDWSIDLLGPPPESVNTPLAAAWRLAVVKFAEQLGKAGLSTADVLEARLDVAMSPPERRVWLAPERDAHDLRFAVEARSRSGRAYRAEARVVIAPHDPRFERRSGSREWGPMSG